MVSDIDIMIIDIVRLTGDIDLLITGIFVITDVVYITNIVLYKWHCSHDTCDHSHDN